MMGPMEDWLRSGGARLKFEAEKLGCRWDIRVRLGFRATFAIHRTSLYKDHGAAEEAKT
jgi:hypothetical protein